MHHPIPGISIADDDDEAPKSEPAKPLAFCVYILRSKKDSQLYIGHGVNAQDALKRHNFGDYRTTNSQRPWVLVYEEGFATKTEAFGRELFFRSEEGKVFVAGLHLK